MTENVAGVRELKARLSLYLNQVEAGETVLIMKHGKPIGRIVPLERTLEERMRALREADVLEWGGGRLPRIAPVARTVGDRDLVTLLIEERS